MVATLAICLSVASMAINAFTVCLLVRTGRALDRTEAANEREA